MVLSILRRLFHRNGEDDVADYAGELDEDIEIISDEEFDELLKEFDEDWERYNFTEVVFKPGKMSPQEFQDAAFENWERIYNLKTLRRKFLKTLQLTKNPTAAVWGINSNLQMRNFVFEDKKEMLDTESAFPGLLDGIKLR